MKHYANPITGRHKPSPLKADANLIMSEGAMRAAGAVKPIAYSSTEQAAEPVAADVAAEAPVPPKVDLSSLETELEKPGMEEIDGLDEKIQLLPK
jgi:hypothetical protein